MHSPLSADEVVLVVLWSAVLAGFLLVVFVVLSALFGWDGRLVSTALAAPSNSPSVTTATTVDGVSIYSDASEAPSPVSLPSDTSQPLALPDRSSEMCVAAIPNASSLPSQSQLVQTSVSGGPLTDVSATVGVTLGKVVQSSIHSDILDMDLPYRVYLPPGYDLSTRRYPALYLLHGNGMSVFAEWTNDNKIGVIADALIAAGKIEPMIIVMPDGEHSYWMNHYDDGERWQDYILDEVIPFFDANYRTIPDKEHRAIGGHSMGGSGALSIALTHPELFTAVGAHSPSLRWSSQGGMPYFGPDWYFAYYNPLDIAKTAAGLSTLKIWVDYGVEDPWLAEGAVLETTLDSRGTDYQWHLYPGNHYVTYWIEHGPDYLEFYSGAFSTTNPFPAGLTC